jgi:4-hydroxythreonine-4-phosphate dehydrogenase
MLADRATALSIPFDVPDYDGSGDQPVSLLSVDLAATVTPGELDPANAPGVLAMLEAAIAGCISGEFSAMVTAPVHKGVINDAGVAFTGHTEMIAERTGGRPVMMLTTPTHGADLRVALATTHLPLAQVAEAITANLIESILRTLAADLQTRFGLDAPRIMVLGLNPHAGEDGHLGREELEVIAPCLDELRSQGMALTGPVAADTAFTPAALAEHDVVLAMYHDQGLPTLKNVGFGQAVNVTLGLPIVRTSVDHGTALNIAATGRADHRSLRAAVDLAVAMVSRSAQRSAA